MKNKKLRIFCALICIVSLSAVVPVMFAFYEVDWMEFVYSVWGYEIFTDTSAPLNIFVGVLGLIGLLWDLVYGAYAVIDGRYRNLTWRIARYGYFYGAVTAVIHLAFIASLCGSRLETAGIVFCALLFVLAAAKIVLIFQKEENCSSQNR